MLFGDIYKHKHLKGLYIELVDTTSKGWKVRQTEEYNVKGDKKLTTPKSKIAYFSSSEINELFKKSDESSKMAKGGKVSFADKVAAIKKNLLSTKKVSPKVKKDYGKKYSPKEAEESARRIAGSMIVKEKMKNKK
jgi:hypothetical protein